MNGDELQRALGRIEGKLDDALPLLHRLDKRVRALELWRSFLAGAVAAIGALVSWVLGWRQ